MPYNTSMTGEAAAYDQQENQNQMQQAMQRAGQMQGLRSKMPVQPQPMSNAPMGGNVFNQISSTRAIGAPPSGGVTFQPMQSPQLEAPDFIRGEVRPGMQRDPHMNQEISQKEIHAMTLEQRKAWMKAHYTPPQRKIDTEHTYNG